MLRTEPWLTETAPRPVEYAPDILDCCSRCTAWQWRYVRRMTMTPTAGAVNLLGLVDVLRCGRCGFEPDLADPSIRPVAGGRD